MRKQDWLLWNSLCCISLTLLENKEQAERAMNSSEFFFHFIPFLYNSMKESEEIVTPFQQILQLWFGSHLSQKPKLLL